MQDFLERAKEFIETLDTEDPNYDFVVEAMAIIRECQYTQANISQLSNEQLNRFNNQINIVMHKRVLTKEVKKIMKE